MKLIKVTLNDVPDTCATEVKRLAVIAVDRYYRNRDEVIAAEVIEASNARKDAFRVANGLAKKYNSKG